MNIPKHLLILFFSLNLHASFYKETVIHPSSPFSVLDPARRPEIERFVTNLRFFGNLGPRPSRDVFIHHQAVQNLLVFPTSHLTALSWMLFPISPLPTINPNNVRVSDPLGKITPEALGKLIGVMGRFANPYSQSYSFADDLLDIFQIFDPERAKELLQNYSPDHNPELQEFYRYSILEAFTEYTKSNVSVDDEDMVIPAEVKERCKTQPHLLVIEALLNSSSHLLEIPGTEILRQDNEICFTEAELDAELQELPKDVKNRTKYKALSYKAREEFKIHAAVDMLYKSAKASPNEVLQLLAFYSWRKFPEQMHDVIWASGAVNRAQYTEIRKVLSDCYSKADYESLVTAFKTAENADAFFESLTAAQQNLLLYGDANYSSMHLQEYGNVRVEHAEKFSIFANCAEMSLFNLTYLAQLKDDGQGIGLTRSANTLPESLLKTFWQCLSDEDLSTTATRNAWTQMLIRRQGVVYIKGGAACQPWVDSSPSHWAEINPGVLNQMRALFHLLDHADEAVALSYGDTTEEIVAAAALKLSRLLNGRNVNDASTDDSLPFIIAIDSLASKPSAKDWFGELTVNIDGSQVATWHIQTGHSYLTLSKQKQVFDPAIKTRNPLIMGQMVIAQPDYSQSNAHEAMTRLQQVYWAQLDDLKGNEEELADFFRHANLVSERLRYELGTWLCGGDKQINDHDLHFSDGQVVRIINRNANAENPLLIPYARRMLWGMCQVDNGRELYIVDNSSLTIVKQPEMKRLVSFFRSISESILFADPYSRACLAYQRAVRELGNVVHGNRVHEMSLKIWREKSETPCLTWARFEEVLENLECLNGKSTLARLKYFYPHFSKSCSGEDVERIMEFMPRSSLRINLIDPVSPQQFFALVKDLHPSCEICMVNAIYWYNGSATYPNSAPLPPTLEECVFNLLEPLARSGKPFEPPFINFGEAVDLEPIYNRLRIIAAMPFAGLDGDELRSAI